MNRIEHYKTGIENNYHPKINFKNKGYLNTFNNDTVKK